MMTALMSHVDSLTVDFSLSISGLHGLNISVKFEVRPLLKELLQEWVTSNIRELLLGLHEFQGMTSSHDSVFYSNNSRWPRSQEIGYKVGDFPINVSRHARG